MLFIIKKKYESIRICIDKRKLNEITFVDAESMPDVNELILFMGKYNIFSMLDMIKGYYKFSVTKESKHFTVISTNKGMYQFNYMRFGQQS